MPPVEKNPGLFDMPQPFQEAGEIETAVIEMFDELENEGVLGPIEKAKKAAMIKAAGAVDNGFRFPVVAVATANVFKQLMEGLESLPRPVTGTDSEMDAFEATISHLTLQAMEEKTA